MHYYEATSLIDARPDAIWAVLTDAPGYAGWDSGLVRVEGRIAPEEKLALVPEINPKRSFRVRVTEFAPGERMVWTGGMPLGLFKGVRTFTLAREDGAMRFRMREELSGPLLPLIGLSLPDFGPPFEQFARGLKARAERG